MNICIKQALVFDSASEFNQQRVDLYITQGMISTSAKAGVLYTTISSPNLCVSPGWFDMRANFCDPGLEHKEDIRSGVKAAERGGFTGVALLPNTKPVVQSKDTIQYLIRSNPSTIVSIYPYAALSTNCKGEELTEILDLKEAGAIAFTDGTEPILHSGLLNKALQYVQPFNGLIIQYADDRKISLYGQMNEGITSTYLGLKGIPNLAEELIVQRDISLLRYSGGSIHFSRISTKESVGLIAKAKKEGLQVTCDVAIPNLLFTDDALLHYDTNYKVAPPLRTSEDLKALWKGLELGTIDAIVTDHTPHDTECKNLEFDLADFGMTMLETALPAFITAGYSSKLALIIEKLTQGPRRILKLPAVSIQNNSEANLTVFDPDTAWTYTTEIKASKSANTPLLNKPLKGKVLAVIKHTHSAIF